MSNPTNSEDSKRMKTMISALRAENEKLRDELSWSHAAKAVAVERACAAAQDEIADLRQKLAWTLDQMDAVEHDKEMVSAAAETAEQEAEAVEKMLRDEIAELKAVLNRIDMDHEIDAYMGRRDAPHDPF